MAEFSPTPSQKSAIETSGRSVLVSAAAGSGKTRVLTERLLRSVCEGGNIDEYLVITFTKAAAAELKSRIADELSRRISDDPENRRLRRQNALCRRAQISTIDGFCTALLRENCHAAGLSPEFRVIEEDRALPLRQRIMDRVLEERYEDPDDDFLLLADTVGRGRDDSRLASLALELHRKMQSHARPELWSQEQLRLYESAEGDASNTPYGREVMRRVSDSAAYYAALLSELAAKAERESAISKAYGASLDAVATALRDLVRALSVSWDKAIGVLPIEFPRLGTLRNSPDPELSERIKEVWNACKDEAKGYAELMPAPSEKLMRELRETAPAMRALIALTFDFDRAYAAEKRRRSEVDFADLEHMTVRLLTDPDGSPSPTALAVGRRFREIMVDEYQDVNGVQDTIFRALSSEGKNLFMVGDVKQSIYRFRLADPGIFTEKYLHYADLDTALPNDPVRIMLRENFRSRREVISAVNSVFSCCMSEKLGEIDYDENAMLRAAADYPGAVPLPEMTIYPLPDSDDEDAPGKAELEAAAVAARIRRLVDGALPVTANGIVRPLRYGDIAILMRSANSVGQVYRRELTKAGVPVAGGLQSGFFASVEISTLISLLGVIDNPHQDIPLIATLRSPVFGFNADELSQIRACRPNDDFYTALCACAEENEKCADFLTLLASLREKASESDASALLWHIYRETDIMPVCTALGDGEERRRNLLLMHEYAKRFTQSGFYGLRRFVRWLLKLSERSDEPGKGETGNAVQIMTVHKSKGLEFPVVFLCDTAKRFNKNDFRSPVLVHPELGLAPKYTDLERRLEYPTLAFNAVKLRSESELLSEEMRLLYVALTRAKEYLFVTAAMKDPEKKLAKLMSCADFPAPPEELRRASCLADWLIAACLADGGENIRLNVSAPDRISTDDECVRTTQSDVDAELKRRIEENLDYVYPHAAAERLPSKLTATELKDEPDLEAQALAPTPKSSFRLPGLRGSEKLTPAERGTATHLVLQYMDYKKACGLASVKDEIARLCASGFITAEQAEVVDADAILRLFVSETGRRILSCDELRREFRFSLLAPSGLFFPESGGEKVLLQGVMDCCIEEDGCLTVIDYKTDRVRGEALTERAKLYSGQLRAYAYAAEHIFGKPLRECVLYFLSDGTAVHFPAEELL